MTVSNYSRNLILALFLSLNSISAEIKAQQIIDSCFTSVEIPGKYFGSNDLQNICMCSDRYFSSDLIEWTPDGQWKGRLYNNPTLDLPPPASDGCLTRAIWIGSEMWTENGEAFGLRLSKPLEAGKTYKYNFTYAADGFDDKTGFEPIIYSATTPSLYFATPIDTLPPADNLWITNSLTFTTSSTQNGHTWLIVHAVYRSGIILSNCKNKNILQEILLPKDTTLCDGDRFDIQMPEGKSVEYLWNTKSMASSLTISEPGTYSIEASYRYCTKEDTIAVSAIDCEVRLTMPNIFTPDGDEFNPTFIPMDYNYIESGNTIILNRWGEKIFSGDLFTGWDGNIDDHEVSTGIYYYRILYTDPKHKAYEVKGIVTLMR